jgi:hypothetical protein
MSRPAAGAVPATGIRPGRPLVHLAHTGPRWALAVYTYTLDAAGSRTRVE